MINCCPRHATISHGSYVSKIEQSYSCIADCYKARTQATPSKMLNKHLTDNNYTCLKSAYVEHLLF